MRKFNSFLFAILAVMAVAQLFCSCEKEEDSEEPKPVSQLTFTTEMEIGSTIEFWFNLGSVPTEIIGATVVSSDDTDMDGGGPYMSELSILTCVLTDHTVTMKGDIISIYLPEMELTSLDVSQSYALESLNCSYNKLTSLNVSNCKKLVQLACVDNSISSLDVSKCPELTHLNCGANPQLTTLDLSKNKALEILTCFMNNMTELDVSNCPKLQDISCSHNKLTSLDVSKNPLLEYLDCRKNKIKAATMSEIIRTLPDWTGKEGNFWPNVRYNGVLRVIMLDDSNEENELNEADKAIAQQKNWEVDAPH